MPTPLLQLISPFEKLVGRSPNCTKLRVFGCLCYPRLKPYTTYKLEHKSKPCVFLGYSSTQSAFKCLDPTTKKTLHLSTCTIYWEYISICFYCLKLAQNEENLSKWAPSLNSPSHISIHTSSTYNCPYRKSFPLNSIKYSSFHLYSCNLPTPLTFL